MCPRGLHAHFPACHDPALPPAMPAVPDSCHLQGLARVLVKKTVAHATVLPLQQLGVVLRLELLVELLGLGGALQSLQSLMGTDGVVAL